MKLFTAEQIRAWDKYTIENEPVHSIELMERAASVCTRYLVDHFHSRSFLVLAGAGNNGGDGLAIARQLKQMGKDVSVLHIAGGALSPDCETNLQRLKPFGIPYKKIGYAYDLPLAPSSDTVVIDAMLGTGQNRPLEGRKSRGRNRQYLGTGCGGYRYSYRYFCRQELDWKYGYTCPLYTEFPGP